MQEVIEGYNCTVFAYGQTGTGKTFTMEGDRMQPVSNGEDLSSWENDPLVGIIPRSVAQLFSNLNAISNCEYSVKISFMELYNEELSDLLSESSENEKLRIFDDSARKGSVVIPGLEEAVVRNKNEVYKILQKGAERRQKASTLMNSQSSRSHSIFCVTVFIKEKSIEGEETIKVGKLNLVDLAGSENIERSGATGKRAAEAGKINKSLTTLGRVITALVEHRDHIPYRESNLTRLLQDSLGGKTKTSIIATISPAAINLEETMSTLDYAYKAKSIRNKPEVNQKLVKQTLIKEYTEEIEKLKRELNSARDKNGIYLPEDLYSEMVSKIDTQKEEIRDNLLKITALTDEIEKLNDLFTETKRNLDEKSESLRATTHKLITTEVKLTAMTKECQETHFLLNEQVKTEQKLYDQASRLLKSNLEMQNDCSELHCKVNRVTELVAKNRCSTNEFSQYLNERFLTILDRENELSEFNKHNFCQLCHLLSELVNKMTETKDENQCQMQIFDEKQKNWFKNHKEHIQENIVDLFAQFANEFMQTSGEQMEKNKSNLETAFNLCNQHKQAYAAKHENLVNSIDELNKENELFEPKFNELTSNYLLENSNQITLASNESINRLSRLESSIDSVKSKTSELIHLTDNFKTYVNDSLNSLQSTMINFTSKINETFQMIGKKFDDLNQESETNASELTNLRELINMNEKSLIKIQTATFDTNINQPIKEILTSNTKSINNLKLTAQSLKEKYETLCSHYDEAVHCFSTTQDENTNNLNKIVFSTITQLDKNSTKINSNIDSYNRESREILNEYTQSIEAEFNALGGIVGESAKVVTDTRDENETHSNIYREFLENGVATVNHFSEKDYADDQPTGNTPKRRKYDVPTNLEKTQPHEDLLESFRKAHTENHNLDIILHPPSEKKLSQDGRISTFIPNEIPNAESTNESNQMPPPAIPQPVALIQQQQQQKKASPAIDKENKSIDSSMGEKQQNLSKQASLSKIARIPSKNKLFAEKN